MPKPFATLDVSTSNIRGPYKDPTSPKTVKYVEKAAQRVFKEDHPDKDPNKYTFKHKGAKYIEQEDFRPSEKDFNSYHKVDVHPKSYGEGHETHKLGEGKEFGKHRE